MHVMTTGMKTFWMFDKSMLLSLDSSFLDCSFNVTCLCVCARARVFV